MLRLLKPKRYGRVWVRNQAKRRQAVDLILTLRNIDRAKILCRQHNDAGSLARDLMEKGVNSV
jgi:hypothetical protein